MTPAILQALEGNEQSTEKLEVVLRGLKSFRQYKDFKHFLKGNIAGVKSVIQTRLSGTNMTLSVEYAGDSDNFLNHVLSHTNLPFNADVEKTGTGTIVFRIKSDSTPSSE